MHIQTHLKIIFETLKFFREFKIRPKGFQKPADNNITNKKTACKGLDKPNPNKPKPAPENEAGLRVLV
jgi:hypothetical protein